MPPLTDRHTVENCVREVVAQTTVTDIHTHLFPPSHGKLLLWGINELLTYHYLVAELFTVAPRTLTPEKFWKLSKTAQADLVWKHVFLERGALSEAARGVLTTLNTLGLNVAGRDLARWRTWFDDQTPGDYLDRVFAAANIDYAVMTNDPFKGDEVKCWQAKPPRPVPHCLKTALRIDTLITDWPRACRTLRNQGFKVDPPSGASPTNVDQARRFLRRWGGTLHPVYLAASLGADFTYPSSNISTDILREIVVPAAVELNIPIALMIGARRKVNPALRDGGDGVGVADVTAVQNLCAEFPQAKFICTMLSRINQHELCVVARKFGNLHVEGCWWFCNVPGIIEEMTRMRLELLGTAFTAQHSDARVLDQVIYKWAHTRKVLADVLVDKYTDLLETNWQPSRGEIQRDVRTLLGGSFETFCRK